MQRPERGEQGHSPAHPGKIGEAESRDKAHGDHAEGAIPDGGM